MTTDWEKKSKFEINKAVAEKLGKVVMGVGDSPLGMTAKYHELYPDTVWVHDVDEVGQATSAQYQFNPCSDWGDAGPIIQENNISLISEVGYVEDWMACWDFYNGEGGAYYLDGTYGDNPLKAAMITYLKMEAR